LQPLALKGYRIFHDVPFLGGKGNYNIDHVVVGPSGVVVVEVKTFRKRRANESGTEHEVYFDGQLLHFPWGKRRAELDQVVRNAESLSKWIFQRTGLDVIPRQVLTFPSWYVKETPTPTIRVVHTDFLVGAVHGNGKNILSDQQIDLIARQLEVQCRDVVD
jgi:hypothetical protein